MRAVWKGAVAFGLVNIPVHLYTATEEHDLELHQVHRDDGGRIRYRKTCTTCNDEITADDIAKTYEAPDGRSVILTADDLEQLPTANPKMIEVVQFCPADQVDPLARAKPYYLVPDSNANRPFALLHDALQRSGRVAVTRLCLRSRERLAVLAAHEKVLTVQSLLWPDEVRPSAAMAPALPTIVPESEAKLAGMLLDAMTRDFDPAGFTDTYTFALTELVESKLAGQPFPRHEHPSGSGEVIELMAALKLSVERAKAARGAGTTEVTQPPSASGRATRKPGPSSRTTAASRRRARSA